MTTLQDLYYDLYPHALAAYARSNPDTESARQMARSLAAECAQECVRLGIIEGAPEPAQRYQASAVGVMGIPSFAQTRPEGPGSSAIVPPGAPQQPVQHFNHVQGTQPFTGGAQSLPGGQQLFPPQNTAPYEPPGQAGVMGSVVQAPTPQGYSALGTNGVIQHPEQRPSGKDVVVAPSNQATIQAVGGAGTTFVPEKIVR